MNNCCSVKSVQIRRFFRSVFSEKTPYLDTFQAVYYSCHSLTLYSAWWILVRTQMTKCDFSKVAWQLYWNHTSAWVFYCKFAAYFCEQLFRRTSLEGYFWHSSEHQTLKGQYFYFFKFGINLKSSRNSKCDALSDLVPFAQFKDCEKHPWWSVILSKVAGFSLQLY